MTHWTRTKPTVPGWYWWCNVKIEARLIQIILGPMDNQLWLKLAEASYIPLAKADGEWSSEAIELPINKEGE
jgi:hypothetical protein